MKILAFESTCDETAVAVVDFWTNSVEANKILLGERGIPASAATADGIADLLDASNQKVVAYINNVVSPNSSDVPAADPAGASEFYNLVDELQEGDTLDFICDYYDYEGNYQDTYPLGEQLTYHDGMRIANGRLDGQKARITYVFTDIYGNEYWTEVLKQ